MRWAMLAIAVVGCKAAHEGTYFIAESKAAFDHVEFYFGSELEGSFATRDSGPQSGDVYQRNFAPGDNAVSAAPGDPRRATYLVPVAGGDALGDYVMVIARDAQDNIGGVGESVAFPIAKQGEIIEVVISLAASDGVETWGSAPGCAAWNRNHGRGWVGVVRDDDRDCDDVKTPTDCNDFDYCAGCTAAKTLCTSPCTIGCANASGCVAAMCAPLALCENPACAATSLDDRFACNVKSAGLPHLDVNVPTQMPNNTPCVDKFQLTLPNNVQCLDPVIELAEKLPDMYTFTVRGNGSACEFDIIDPPNPGMFVGDHHLLVSIDPGDGSVVPRPTFLFGAFAVSKPTCSGSISTTNTLVIETCN